ncbi:MAG: hypothetical protein WCE75_05660 [Terracidiphilus sp.]
MRNLLIVAVLLWAAPLWSLEPKPETNRAFDEYASAAEARMHGGAFLYADAHGDARAAARQGQTFVVELRNRDVQVPDGAIHDWLAVAFFPGASIAGVRTILQDYAGYKRTYMPDVSDSRLVAREGDRFHIFLRLENKQFLTLHYNSEYDVSYATPGPGKMDVVSRSTGIRQDGEDNGFLWRLNSYWRFEEGDGGVYAECRSISLSRGIPFAFGWLREALEKFPRDSMVRTMEATRRAAAGAGH